jgi:hypothetical protein
MGCFNVWCPLCGGPLNESLEGLVDDKLTKEFIKIIKSKTKWLVKITILLSNRKAKHGFRETYCNTFFINNKGEEYDLHPDDGIEGLPLHTDCWKFAKKVMKRECTYSDFNNSKLMWGGKSRKVKKIDENTKSKIQQYYRKNGMHAFAFSNLNYIPIVKYWDQIFNLDELDKNKNHWYLLYSPLGTSPESKKNAYRILKNIKNINKKKSAKPRKDRPSPSESATSYDKGKKKKGNDGNMYVVVVNKNGVKRWKKE